MPLLGPVEVNLIKERDGRQRMYTYGMADSAHDGLARVFYLRCLKCP